MSLMQTSWLNYPATLDYAPLAPLQNVEVLAPNLLLVLFNAHCLYFTAQPTTQTRPNQPAFTPFTGNRSPPYIRSQSEFMLCLSNPLLKLPEHGRSQNRKAGKDSVVSTSVDTPISRHRSASAARVASAWPAYSTASLPGRRCAGRLSAPPPPASRCGGFNRPALGVSADV